MSAQLLKSAFDPFFQAPLEAWEGFADLCDTLSYPKDHVLKEAHTCEKYFYFMISGSAGVFIWKENNFACLDFIFENNFFADYMSIVTGQSTPLQIITLEECRVLRMTRENYLKLGEEEMGSFLMRIAAESSFISKQQQQIDLLTKTAAQRYATLLELQPHIVQRVAQKHLASYLGITPESFSRIRKNIR